MRFEFLPAQIFQKIWNSTPPQGDFCNGTQHNNVYLRSLHYFMATKLQILANTNPNLSQLKFWKGRGWCWKITTSCPPYFSTWKLLSRRIRKNVIHAVTIDLCIEGWWNRSQGGENGKKIAACRPWQPLPKSYWKRFRNKQWKRNSY